MNWQWSSIKNAANFRKHGVWFEEAQTIWADGSSMEFFDPQHSENEDRYIRVGYSIKNRFLLVVFCERPSVESIRIISARKATVNEKRAYEEGI